MPANVSATQATSTNLETLHLIVSHKINLWDRCYISVTMHVAQDQNTGSVHHNCLLSRTDYKRPKPYRERCVP